MRKLNLGIIGLGFIGKVHLRNCLKLKSARVLAAADTSKKALNYAKEFRIKQLFTDYRELLKLKDLDAVIISLPTHLHAECAINAIEEGKHVFLEKPLARNPEEGKEIISAVKKYDVKFMVGYPLRCSHEFVNLKRQLESGVLGEIQSAYAVDIGAGPFFHRAEGTVPRPVPEWWLNRKFTGGGALMDLGCHMINLLRWYLGEVSDIKTRLGYRFNFDFEDYATCIVDFECGASAVVNVGWFSQSAAISVELHGTVAHARAYHSPSGKVATAIKLILGGTPKFFIPYMKELSHFVDWVNDDNKENRLSGENALRDLEVIAKAYKNQIE
ncbi:MAG: Gfo/Idh/MocA family oxidoreductase [Candidatus Bathyarchaeota archaeon]|jgi:predicted dehydrogenase|nr:Gfo/Idh/MocA family oxidoreductase [Candidatus Bathyarchaeota archaeon]